MCLIVTNLSNGYSLISSTVIKLINFRMLCRVGYIADRRKIRVRFWLAKDKSDNTISFVHSSIPNRLVSRVNQLADHLESDNEEKAYYLP